MGCAGSGGVSDGAGEGLEVVYSPIAIRELDAGAFADIFEEARFVVVVPREVGSADEQSRCGAGGVV